MHGFGREWLFSLTFFFSLSFFLSFFLSLFPTERYRIQSDSFEDIWLVAKELVQRFDSHFQALGVKDFRNSFSGPIPLSEYFETVDQHFEVSQGFQNPQSGKKRNGF